MNEATLVALLGRPLTSYEVENRKKYLKIAQERLEDLTCLYLEEATEDRTYDVREGYHTVFTDLFTNLNSVSVNGVVIDASTYQARQWDRRNANWYNSIVLDTCSPEDEITVNADFGICSPTLELLQAKLFGLIGQMNSGNGNVKSKKVEDFSITFNDNTVYEQFCIDNEALINKYSLCNIQDVQHGDVRGSYRSYLGRPY